VSEKKNQEGLVDGVLKLGFTVREFAKVGAGVTRCRECGAWNPRRLGGLVPTGWFDWIILYKGRIYGFETKDEGKGLSDDQVNEHAVLEEEAGIPSALVETMDDVLEALLTWRLIIKVGPDTYQRVAA
jgi:hypothetical protein